LGAKLRRNLREGMYEKKNQSKKGRDEKRRREEREIRRPVPVDTIVQGKRARGKAKAAKKGAMAHESRKQREGKQQRRKRKKKKHNLGEKSCSKEQFGDASRDRKGPGTSGTFQLSRKTARKNFNP